MSIRKTRPAQILVEHNIEWDRVPETSGPLSSWATRRLRWIETLSCRMSRAVVVASVDDRNRLCHAHVPENKVHIIPHGVNLSAYTRNNEDPGIRRLYQIPENALVVFYHGTYCYPPNCEALKRLAQSILPQLQNTSRPVWLLGVGAAPPVECRLPNVVLPGAVDDIAAHIAAADLCLVPLTSGGGTRLKVLEYLAAGKPIIATHKAVEGIGLIPETHFFPADADASFVHHVYNYLANPTPYQQIAENGRQFVQPYDWSRMAHQYFQLYQQLSSISPGTRKEGVA